MIDFFLADTLATGAVLAVVFYLSLGVKDVAAHERGVHLRLGKLKRVMPPGKAITLPGFDRFHAVDMRPYEVKLEVDGSTITATCRVLQPELMVETGSDPQATPREVLRELAQGAETKNLGKLGRQLKKAANERTLLLGIDVEQVEVSA